MFKRHSPRGLQRRQTDVPSVWRHIGIGSFVCLFVALCTFAVWKVTRLPVFTINDVRVEGGETIASSGIKEKVDEVLGGSYLKLIPYRFTFLYPYDAVMDTLMRIPRIKDATIVRSNASLIVSFTEYTPYALWCLGQIDASCYFLDEFGYAFASAPELTGGAFVRYVLESEPELLKKQVFEERVFFNIREFLAQLENTLSLRVTEVLYTLDGDVRLFISGGGELKMRDGDSYDSVYKNLASILESKEFDHIEPGNFKYIDLRFGNKVFVNEKLVDDPIATSTGTSTEEVGQ